MNPPIELLLIGTGDKIHHEIYLKVRESLKNQGVVVEVLDTTNACATFNILNSENRQVAAAILTNVQS